MAEQRDDLKRRTGGRHNDRRRLVVAALAVVLLASTGVLLSQIPGLSQIADDSPTETPSPVDSTLAPPTDSKCRNNEVTIYTGQRDSPYYNYGEVIKKWVEDVGLEPNLQPTTGSSENLELVSRESNSQCGVAVVQLTTAADAVTGEGIWGEGGMTPLSNVMAVGPIFYDLVHVIVRAGDISETKKAHLGGTPPTIGDLDDLCQSGVAVAKGHETSGVRQIANVVQNVLHVQTGEECNWETTRDGEDNGAHIPYSLSRLQDGWVDAVFWVGGSPTSFVENFLRSELPEPELKLLSLKLNGVEPQDPLHADDFDECAPGEFASGEPLRPPRSLLQAMEREFDRDYCEHIADSDSDDHLGRVFYRGYVYNVEALYPKDYAPIEGEEAGEEVPTVAVPNGVVVNTDADEWLVHFLTRRLDERRDELQRALWRDKKIQRGREFPKTTQLVQNPLFCFVPLRAEAKEYHRQQEVDAVDMEWWCNNRRR